MAKRSRRYYRAMRRKAIARKKRIINSYRTDNPPAYINDMDDKIIKEFDRTFGNYEGYFFVKSKEYGRLDKGKIHCSCSLCGFHETPFQDKKLLNSMEDKINNYLENGAYDYNEEYDDYNMEYTYHELYESHDDNYLIPGINVMINKIHKRTSKYSLPGKGYKGTRIGSDSSPDYEDFKQRINEHDSSTYFMTKRQYMNRMKKN